MSFNHDSIPEYLFKLLVALVGTGTGAVVGFITVYGQVIVWTMTSVYVGFNLYFLLRDKWWRDPKRKNRSSKYRRS